MSRFLVCLHLPSEHRDYPAKLTVGTYITSLLTSVVPVSTFATAPGRSGDHEWTSALLSGIHYLYLSWVVSGLNVTAIYYQVRETISRSLNEALSYVGLALQAVIFASMAFSWIRRVNFPYEGFAGYPWGFVITRYELVGWAAVNTGIFALGQAILSLTVSRYVARGKGTLLGEAEPLFRA